ncbi:MAG: molybdopterin molybdotransferase MoeA [Sphingobacteriales bacterium]|nr:molybdopterin molybdotransferase MoeA [Sphingobacteriales bacterium]
MKKVTEAKKLILENCSPPGKELISLSNAMGFVLAEPVLSPVDTPPFNQSAMDGFAFSFDTWDGHSNLTIRGEIQTGNYDDRYLKPLEAVRIFTGAALPPNADTVVMLEKILLKDNFICIKDDSLTKGTNVRLRGSQTKRGELAMNSGQLLTAPAISFLAGMGIEKVNVFSKPVISIIVTGKELIAPGNAITPGKIFESNSFGLAAALEQLHISPFSVQVVDDNEEEIIKTITKHLQSDILILTGGISVGDYDLVAPALEKCGVKQIFHKVKQKPGKPFYFGIYNHTLVFALPGNPGAVMTCFYEYIVPAISCYTRKEYFRKLTLPLENSFTKKPGLTYFLKGKTKGNSVVILDNQESYLMNSFAIADCIIELDEEKEHFNPGDRVFVQMIY